MIQAGHNEDLFKRIRSSLLYQPFLVLMQKVLKELDGQGHRFYATSGLRTYEEQDALFARGGVTKARGGQSLHNFGIGVDSCHDSDVDVPGLQPDYKTKAEYQLLADTGRKHGLEAGFYWSSFPDGPHLQLPIRARGIRLAQLDACYRKGGYPAVFKFLDKYRPW